MKSAWFLAAAFCAAATLPDTPQWRPDYHFSPTRNFMNDPNGLVFYKGEYHLFFQHNPFGNEWGHMSWGHAVSNDLLHWKHLPVALAEENGVMIFSGSAVVDRENSSGFCKTNPRDKSCLVAIYTGHSERKQTQNIAYSNDRGRTWTKYPGNPVIDLDRKEFRDPKVIWHEPSRSWVMVAALPDMHKVRFFRSADLIHWEALSDFGPAGSTEGVWECPDLFPLGERWVLVVNVGTGAPAGGSGTQYFVGQFDGREFHNGNPAGQTLWADYGKDFYAAQSFSNFPEGKRVWMGWMSNWQYANKEPTSPWRCAQTIPRELSLKDGRLVQTPISGLEALRTRAWKKPRQVRGETYEVLAELEGEGGFNVRGTLIQVGGGQITVDRTRSGAPNFSPEFASRHSAPLAGGKTRLRLLVDRSSIEIFVNDGELVLTERIFPPETDQTFEATGRLSRFEAWELHATE